MNAILLLSSRRPVPPDEAGRAFRAQTKHADVDAVSNASGPEATITVSFAGLSEAEQRRALESFPGGRRCMIAQQ